MQTETDTQTHRHTDKQTHRQPDTYTQTRTDTHHQHVCLSRTIGSRVQLRRHTELTRCAAGRRGRSVGGG
eukprot:1722755-Rhodomonas_salina.2